MQENIPGSGDHNGTLSGRQESPDVEDTQPAATNDSTQIEGPLEQLVAERQKAEEYLDLLRRTQADYMNYRRRINQEQEEVRTMAQIAVLQQLLPVLDDLGRALESAPPELRDQPWVQGLLLVAKRLMATLEQLGVQRVGKPGERFNPHMHEAVAMEERSDIPEGIVLNVTRSGYAYRERIIRPAQVIVSHQGE